MNQTTINKNIANEYFKAKQDLFDAVGFIPSWTEYPIEDNREYYWMFNNSEVVFCKDGKFDDESEDFYYDTIYKDRFYKKHIYTGTDITMIFCDTQTDGMKVFGIFDNAKRRDYKDIDEDEDDLNE